MMHLSEKVFKSVAQHNAHLVVVSKYYNKEETELLIKKCDQYKNLIYGYGENRVDGLDTKSLDRDQVHFIGNLQSNKLKVIAQQCSVIHSLDSIKHAQKLNELLDGQSIGVFLQIMLDKDKPNGIRASELERFTFEMQSFENLEVLGLSGMGKAMTDSSEAEKRSEFQVLKQLRDMYLPGRLISAGTSQDYKVALEEGIEVVRVGRAIFK